MTTELDFSLLGSMLRAEDKQILDRAETNVKSAVDQIINKFRTALEEKAAEFERGRFDADLARKVDEVVARYSAGIAEAAGKAAAITALVETATTEMAKVDAKSGALDEAMKQMRTATKSLADEIEALKAKAQSFGKVVGGAAAGSVLLAMKAA